MPYTIPSYTVTPGTVYQPGRSVPPYITANARALYCNKGNAFSDGMMLDQLPSNNGTRRTGEQGRAYTADGIDDEVNFGDIGSAIWFSGWVKLNSDDQCLFSLSNDTNTNVIVSSGVLTAGATLTLTGIKVDDVSKTASEAGALLNDNSWHFLSCGIGDGLGGASTADDVRFFTDGTNHGSVSGFDWRFWSTTPTAAELTEVYIGESPSRNSAALSNYALWAKCDEQSGTTAYDSSGNGNNGTLTNITAATFHSTQNIWSFQNQVGFNKRMYFDGVDDYVNFNSFNVDTSGGFEVNLKVYIPDSSAAVDTIFHNYSNTAKDIAIQASGGALRSTLRSSSGSFSKSWDSLTSGFHEIKVNFDGSNLSLFVNGVEYIGTNAVSLVTPTGDQGLVLGRRITGTGTGDRYFQGIISNLTIDVGNTGALNNLYQGYGNTDAGWIDQIGSNDGTVNGSPSNILLPRDESDPANDVLGNPLTNTGRRPNDAALHSSNCLTADGTLYIAAAHLAGTETVVSSGGTSTPSISAGRIDFTAGTCWDLTLSDGTHYPLSEGWGVDIGSSTSDNDGVLTNSVLANAWGATQNEYHYNLISGFSLYEHASTAAIRWPFKNGSVKTLTPPTGYSKTSDNYPGDYHNNAETLIDLDPDSTPEMGASQLGITVPASHAFGDVFAASNQIFSRQRTLTEDRFVVMPEAQTGSALATIQKYTQP